MSKLLKGLLIAGLHVVLVVSLGAKLLLDRASYPRVWVKAAPADPNLPIRGRYVSLRLELPARDFDPGAEARWARLRVEEGQLLALPSEAGTGHQARISPDGTKATLWELVAFFIPEHVPDPSRRQADEELWVEVTVPKKGPPRPIRLGVKKNGALTPLELH